MKEGKYCVQDPLAESNWLMAGLFHTAVGVTVDMLVSETCNVTLMVKAL